MSTLEKDLDDLELERDDAKKAPLGTKNEDEGEYIAIEDDDGEEEQDERLSADQRDPDDRDDVRDRRRKERKDKRDRQRAARDANRHTIDVLSKQLREATERLSSLEGRSINRESQDVDARINEVSQRFHNAERVLQESISRSDGATAARALQERDRMQQAYNELRGVKARITAAAKAPAAPEVDPRVVGYAQEFMQRHSWVDLDGKDEDSAIVKAIDERLVDDGFDPETEDYWDELTARIKKRLPHKFQSQKSGRESGPPMGSGREHVPNSTRREIYVSPERKAAMIAAGKWDNPEERKRLLKAYALHDKQNAAR